MRTRAGLEAARARGVKLGNLNPGPAAKLGSLARAKIADEFVASVISKIEYLRRFAHRELSLRDIAQALNVFEIEPLCSPGATRVLSVCRRNAESGAPSI